MDDDRFDDEYWASFAVEFGKLSKCSTHIIKVINEPKRRYISFLVHERDGDIIYQLAHSWDKDGSPSKPITHINIDVGGGGRTSGPDVFYSDYIALGRFSIWWDASQYAEDIWDAIQRYNQDD